MKAESHRFIQCSFLPRQAATFRLIAQTQPHNPTSPTTAYTLSTNTEEGRDDIPFQFLKSLQCAFLIIKRTPDTLKALS